MEPLRFVDVSLFVTEFGMSRLLSGSMGNGGGETGTRCSSLQRLSYYHPHLRNLEEVRTLMTDYILMDGSFILRKSFSKPGLLTVTVM